MNKNNSLKINILFQTIYQILEILIPLITAPYLARALGASQLGVFSYTSSIVAYFSLFAMLGIMNYGTKSISFVSSDEEEINTVFTEVYSLQFITCLIAIISYVIYLLYFCSDNVIISLIQILTLVSCILNINWFFFGLEKFKITVSRNIVIRFLTVISIFIFVKQPTDLWKYVLIMLSSSCLSQIILWFYLRNYVNFTRVKFKNVLKRLKPNIMLFIPLLAMSIYHIMDKTMLGFFCEYDQSGYYYNADKIVNITVNVIAGFSTVLLPRITMLIGNDKIEEANNLFCTSLEATVFLGSAMAFGIASIAKEFIPLFFGNGYEDSVILTILLSPVLIIKAFSFTARYQYLVPNNKEKDFIVSVLIGAFINIVFNVIFIPKLGAMGAVLGTIIAELCACIWQFIVINKYIELRETILRCLTYTVLGVLMLIVIRIVSFVLPNNMILKIFVEILTGIVFYLISCVFVWKKDNNRMILSIFNSIPILEKIENKFKIILKER